MCSLTKVVCPEHEGGFDCTPFCATCEGEQEYTPKCEPTKENKMAKYKVEVNRHYTYVIEVDATDEMDAIEQSRDWEIEDLEPHQTDAWFNYDIDTYPEEEESK